MNTRLRVPFLDPLFTALAGGGIFFLLAKYSGQRLRPAPSAPAGRTVKTADVLLGSD
jgi:hypothetical protein